MSEAFSKGGGKSYPVLSCGLFFLSLSIYLPYIKYGRWEELVGESIRDVFPCGFLRVIHAEKKRRKKKKRLT